MLLAVHFRIRTSGERVTLLVDTMHSHLYHELEGIDVSEKLQTSRTRCKSCITVVAQTVMEKTTGGPRIGDHIQNWPSTSLARW